MTGTFHNILGLETSCDETSAAVLSDGRIRSNIISSQTIHEKYGGVVPELASRAHIRLIDEIADAALKKAGIGSDEVDGIAVTYGPGLVGALLVGLNFAKGLSQGLGVPYIGVNHIEGHIYGNFITHPGIRFPHLCLIVSGGHTQLVIMKAHLSYRIIGKTRDDAVGEAFDKAAKMLGLGYPGGPLIDRLAAKGDPGFHQFPRAYMKGDNFDFSYSGLKTSLLIYKQSESEAFIAEHLTDICAAYQKAAVEVLVTKTLRAAAKFDVASIGVVGGVAANSLLRKWLAEESGRLDIPLHLPEMGYCTDNAAMIARAGWQRLSAGISSGPDLNAKPSLTLNTGQM